MQYFKELYPEMKVTGYCDKYVKKLKRAEIDVNLVWLEKRLGKHLTNDEIQGKLERSMVRTCMLSLRHGVPQVTFPLKMM